MKINPRLGTGIICIIFIVVFFIVIKILSIDFEQIKLFYYGAIVIIAYTTYTIFDKLNKRK